MREKVEKVRRGHTILSHHLQNTCTVKIQHCSDNHKVLPLDATLRSSISAPYAHPVPVSPMLTFTHMFLRDDTGLV